MIQSSTASPCQEIFDNSRSLKIKQRFNNEKFKFIINFGEGAWFHLSETKDIFANVFSNNFHEWGAIPQEKLTQRFMKGKNSFGETILLLNLHFFNLVSQKYELSQVRYILRQHYISAAYTDSQGRCYTAFNKNAQYFKPGISGLFSLIRNKASNDGESYISFIPEQDPQKFKLIALK